MRHLIAALCLCLAQPVCADITLGSELYLNGQGAEAVLLDGKLRLEGVDYEYNPETKKLKIKTSTYSKGQYLIQY